MKIAQVAPLYESVPPKFYGGTERIVHYLTEALIQLGHTVTLFASGDSKTEGELISNVEEALRLNNSCVDPLAHHIVQLQEVIERTSDFDIIHFHNDYLHFPFSQNMSTPHVTTLHGRLDIPDLKYVYHKFCDQPVISISNNQRKPLPEANFVGTVYHGLPKNLYTYTNKCNDYLAFLGRISPEKGLDQAIEIAKGAGIKLKIAAKIDKVDVGYFNRNIKHLFDHPLIEFIGEINDAQKNEFLGNAMALLFPINWIEPFGMVLIEAMACGTPVIAYRKGSVPEIIENGKNGFIVNSVAEAISAVSKIDTLSRYNIRQIFEKRFTAQRMAKDYLKIYNDRIEKKHAALDINMTSYLPGNTIPIKNTESRYKIM